MSRHLFHLFKIQKDFSYNTIEYAIRHLFYFQIKLIKLCVCTLKNCRYKSPMMLTKFYRLYIQSVYWPTLYTCPLNDGRWLVQLLIYAQNLPFPKALFCMLFELLLAMCLWFSFWLSIYSWMKKITTSQRHTLEIIAYDSSQNNFRWKCTFIQHVIRIKMCDD